MKALKIVTYELLLLLLLVGCQSSSPHEIRGIAMTMGYRVLIGEKISKTKEAAIQSKIESIFSSVDLIMNKWNPKSEVAKLNKLKAFEKHPLSPELFDLFQKADMLFGKTEGLFDPTVETLRYYLSPFIKSGHKPPQELISSLKQKMGWEKLHWKEGVFWKDDEDVRLDFGAIAKGLTVDLILEELEALGYQNAYVEWGGEIATVGQHPSGRNWRVAIRTPSSQEKHLTEMLSKGSAIATSGDEIQYYAVESEPEGEIIFLSHLYNPINGSPKEILQGATHTASILSTKCYIADAYATALALISDPKEAKAWATKARATDPDILDFWIESQEGDYTQ